MNREDKDLLLQEIQEMLAMVQESIDTLRSHTHYDANKSNLAQCLETVPIYLLDQAAELEGTPSHLG